MVSQSLKYALDEVTVTLEVFLVGFPFPGSRVDGDVVHVYCYAPLINQVSEDGVHHGLERGWGISEAEEHDGGFI